MTVGFTAPERTSFSPKSKIVSNYMSTTRGRLPTNLTNSARNIASANAAPVVNPSQRAGQFGFQGPEMITAPQGRQIADTSVTMGNAAIADIGASANNAVSIEKQLADKAKIDEIELQRQKYLKETEGRLKTAQGELDKKISEGFKFDESKYQGSNAAPVMGKNGSASWIKSNEGRYHDFDGAYGAQCVDLYNFYTTGFVGGDPKMAGVQGASDIWNNYDSNAYLKVNKLNTPRQGDVVVYDRSYGGGYGHVGIVSGVNRDGTLNVLQANATSAGPAGKTIISKMSTGRTMGYLRPRKLA